MIPASAAGILAWLYAVLLGAAAAQDVLTRRISNLFSVAIVLVGVLALILHPGPHWWQYLLSFAIVLALGLLLFNFEWMGGGDAKLMAAAALAFDLIGLLRFLPLALILGGVIAFLSIVIRTILPGQSGKHSKGVPYGLAIAIGAIVALSLFREHSVFHA